MAIAKNVYTGKGNKKVITLSGTLAELGQALADERVQPSQVLAAYSIVSADIVIYQR